MQEIHLVELFSEEQRCAVLTAADILHAFPDADDYFVARDWKTACKYLSAFTNPDGVCRLPLDRELDGNTADYAKMIAVFMIFSALMNRSLMQILPLTVSMRAMPYIKSRLGVLQIDMAKYKRMDDFAKRALRLIAEAPESDRGIDEIFAEILDGCPSVKSFAAVSEPDIERYLPLFAMLHEKAQICSTPVYAEQIAEYIAALKEAQHDI